MHTSAICALALLLTCRAPHVAQGLAGLHLAAAGYDGAATIDGLHRHPQWRENDPLVRALLGARPQPAPMLAVGYGSVAAATWLSERMRQSHTWTRKVWWLPQVVGISAHVAEAMTWR